MIYWFFIDWLIDWLVHSFIDWMIENYNLHTAAPTFLLKEYIFYSVCVLFLQSKCLLFLRYVSWNMNWTEIYCSNRTLQLTFNFLWTSNTFKMSSDMLFYFFHTSCVHLSKPGISFTKCKLNRNTGSSGNRNPCREGCKWRRVHLFIRCVFL